MINVMLLSILFSAVRNSYDICTFLSFRTSNLYLSRSIRGWRDDAYITPVEDLVLISSTHMVYNH